MSTRTLFAALALAGVATGAMAHQLNVFAHVERDTVVVESKFSNGKVPILGEVRVLDAADALLMTLPLGDDGTLRFPLDPATAAQGLTIEVSTGEGHENYWILTPEDIARGSENPRP